MVEVAIGLMPEEKVYRDVKLSFLFPFFEFCFAIAAHTHCTVVLTVLVFGALCDNDAAAVADQGTNVSVKFYNCVFVIHKIVREKPHPSRWGGIACRRKPTLLSRSFRLSYQTLR
jgi:hypothetical protein